MAMAACSTDEEPILAYTADDIRTNAEGPVRLSLRLLNEDMQEATVFKVGKNFVFDFTIENLSDADFLRKKTKEDSDLILDGDFFCVYKENGERVDTPWNYWWWTAMEPSDWVYPPHSERHIRCQWYAREPFVSNGDNPVTKGLDGEKPFLPKGKYYTKFTVVYNSTPGQDSPHMVEQEYIIHFKIK